MEHFARKNKGRQIYIYPRDGLPQSDVVILGTIHRFPEGEDLLQKALFALNPRIITVELSPFSFVTRRRNEKRWLEKFEKIIAQENLPLNSALKSFREALRIPYEFALAKSLNLAPVIPIDLNRPARKYLSRLEEALCLENLRILANLDTSPYKELYFAKFYLEGLYKIEKTKEDLLREKHMAEKIKKLADKKRPLVHIGGWRHLPALLDLLPEAKGILLIPAEDISR